MGDAERYVSQDELEAELSFDPDAFPADDWDDLVTRLLAQESERVEGPDYANREWDDADDVPGPVFDGIVRLVRSRLQRIKADGVESESTVSGQSLSYRPPEAVRADVQSAVSKYREDDEESGAWLV